MLIKHNLYDGNKLNSSIVAIGNYDGVLGYLFNMMQPDISIPVGHCLVALNNHEEEFCVECKSGYTFINDVCTATGLDINNFSISTFLTSISLIGLTKQ